MLVEERFILTMLAICSPTLTDMTHMAGSVAPLSGLALRATAVSLFDPAQLILGVLPLKIGSRHGIVQPEILQYSRVYK